MKLHIYDAFLLLGSFSQYLAERVRAAFCRNNIVENEKAEERWYDV